MNTMQSAQRTRFLSLTSFEFWKIIRVYVYGVVVIGILCTVLRDVYFYSAENLFTWLIIIFLCFAIGIGSWRVYKFLRSPSSLDMFFAGAFMGGVIGIMNAIFLIIWTPKLWSLINLIREPIHWAVIGGIIGWCVYLLFRNNRASRALGVVTSAVKTAHEKASAYVSSEKEPARAAFHAQTPSKPEEKKERNVIKVTIKDQQ